MVDTDVGFIFQQDKTVFVPTSATTGFQAFIVQLSGNVYKRHASSGFAENLPDDLGVRLVNRKAAIRPLAVPERIEPEFTLQFSALKRIPRRMF